MTKTISAAHAKTHLAEILRVVEGGEAVVITRYGKAVAAMVAAEDLEQIERLRAAGPEEGLGGLLGKWSDGSNLVDALDSIVEDRSTGRNVPEFG